jgi:hypothetical protein
MRWMGAEDSAMEGSAATWKSKDGVAARKERMV